MKKKTFIIAAILFAGIYGLTAQVIIKNGNDKAEVKGKEVKVNSRSTSAQQSAGNITITGAGNERITYDGNGKVVSISGSNHDIRITGNPNRITVSGSNNGVYTDGAKSISISGSNNEVMYYNLINKKRPSISISGHNNTVVKGTL